MGFFKKEIKKVEMAKPEINPTRVEPVQLNRPSMVQQPMTYQPTLYPPQNQIPIQYSPLPYQPNVVTAQEPELLNEDSSKSEIIKHIKNLNSLRDQIDEIRRRLNTMDEYLTLTLRALYN